MTSVNAVFDRDGSIDFVGIRRHIDFVLAAGSKALILTYGDSPYSLLSDEEVGEVTRMTVKQAAGRALLVAADRMWATRQAVAFARYAREVGVDLVMPLPPTWVAFMYTGDPGGTLRGNCCGDAGDGRHDGVGGLFRCDAATGH